MRPSVENATSVEKLVPDLNSRSRRPVLTLQNETFANAADASTVPSGENASEWTDDGSSIVASSTPVRRSHSLIRPSRSPDASSRPSGEKTTAVAASEWPLSTNNLSCSMFWENAAVTATARPTERKNSRIVRRDFIFRCFATNYTNCTNKKESQIGDIRAFVAKTPYCIFAPDLVMLTSRRMTPQLSGSSTTVLEPRVATPDWRNMRCSGVIGPPRSVGVHDR